ncbi:MAG: disulfide bond formation protein B [Hellea sp.]|nr:disulfide bond formation protein B [Hellea sp.]
MTGFAFHAYIQPMNFIAAKNIPVFALVISGGLISGAWFFQFVLGYSPCTMCYWQRWAHWGVLALAALMLIASRAGQNHSKLFAALIGLAFLVSFGLALWHVGVEYKWWAGPQTCAVSSVDIEFDINDPLGGLDNVKPPACSVAAWRFLGLSMAGWNAVVSLGAAVLSFIGASRHD